MKSGEGGWGMWVMGVWGKSYCVKKRDSQWEDFLKKKKSEGNILSALCPPGISTYGCMATTNEL